MRWMKGNTTVEGARVTLKSKKAAWDADATKRLFDVFDLLLAEGNPETTGRLRRGSGTLDAKSNQAV